MCSHSLALLNNQKERMSEYHNSELLEELYWEQGLSTTEIADKFGVSHPTICYHMKKNGVSRRDNRESHIVKYKNKMPKMWMDNKGYERFHVPRPDPVASHQVGVHRLVAVAEYGFDAVCNMVVHHVNEIPWDNRPENIEVMTFEEHNRLHATQMMETRERNERGQVL